jgi:CheY-like chemotaxis protein
MLGAEGAMAKAHILVVEDESLVAKDLQIILRHLGYHVPVVVFSGEQAIRRVEEARPDLVLMDIRLKGALDGVEAAARIRSRCDVPVVYLTANADEATLERAKVTEPFGYILKPFEEHLLQSTIEMALQKHAKAARSGRPSRQAVSPADPTASASSSPSLSARDVT